MTEPTSPSRPSDRWPTFSAEVQAIHSRLCQTMPRLGPHLHPEKSFRMAGGDSIDFVELLCALEADYGVRFSEDEISAMTTVGELLMLVDRQALRRPA